MRGRSVLAASVALQSAQAVTVDALGARLGPSVSLAKAGIGGLSGASGVALGRVGVPTQPQLPHAKPSATTSHRRQSIVHPAFVLCASCLDLREPLEAPRSK